MKPSHSAIRLSWLIAVLALIASGVGLFYRDGGVPFSFTTMHGTTVHLYGQGLYRYETLVNGVGFKGVDAFVLIFAIPLLIAATSLYRRGSLRGGLVLLGTLAYFLYNAAHQAFNYAYNPLFLVYVALLSASFFAVVLVFASFDHEVLAQRFPPDLPRRTIAGYLFVVGASLVIVWGGLSVLPALLRNSVPPELGSYTTLSTYALDMGILAPVAFLAGSLLLRRAPLGYLLAPFMVIISWTIGGAVAALSVAQLGAGLLSPFQFGVFVAPFALLTLVGIGLTVRLFRHFDEPHAVRAAYA